MPEPERPDRDEEPAELVDDPDAGERAEPAPADPGRTTTESTVPCPFCGEPVDLFLEPSTETSVQEFVEECPACSRDFEVKVRRDAAGVPHVEARRTQ